jgi:hypothetical protein
LSIDLYRGGFFKGWELVNIERLQKKNRGHMYGWRTTIKLIKTIQVEDGDGDSEASIMTWSNGTDQNNASSETDERKIKQY